MMLAPPPAAAEIQNPESGSVAERQTAYIMHVGLNAQQGEVLIRVAGKYYDYLARLQAQATQIAGAAVPSGVRLTASQLDKLKAISSGRRAFLLQLIWDLHQELDDQGDRILRQYIDQQVRPNVRFR
jgi:hypothetical protein